MHPAHSIRRGFVARSALLLFGLTGAIAGTIIASIHLRETAGTLRQEQTLLIQQQEKLRAELLRCDEQLRAIAVDERQQASDPSLHDLSPEQRRVLDRAGRGFKAQANPSSRDSNSSEIGLLVQSKAGKIYFPELLADGAYAKAALVVERLQIETAYVRLFAALKLTPGEREQFTQLLTEREMEKQDILGLGSNTAATEVMQHRLQASRDWKNRLKEEFGPACVQAVDAYDATLLLRDAIAALETRLSYTGAPLTPLQADRLSSALVTALGPKTWTRYWSIPDSVINQMPADLSSAQIMILKQIQEEQLGLIEARDVRNGEAIQL